MTFWDRMRKAASFAHGAPAWKQAGINLNPRNFETGTPMEPKAVCGEHEGGDPTGQEPCTCPPPEEVKEAIVAYVPDEDGKILVVWNKRYGRWGLPGGRREPGESRMHTLFRELGEELGKKNGRVAYGPIYAGAHGESVASTRGSVVYVYRVVLGPGDVPYEAEPGCPVTRFTREEFLKWGLAPAFYRKMFEAIDTAV